MGNISALFNTYRGAHKRIFSHHPFIYSVNHMYDYINQFLLLVLHHDLPPATE